MLFPPAGDGGCEGDNGGEGRAGADTEAAAEREDRRALLAWHRWHPQQPPPAGPRGAAPVRRPLLRPVAPRLRLPGAPRHPRSKPRQDRVSSALPPCSRKKLELTF